jgi:hypothetical protein
MVEIGMVGAERLLDQRQCALSEWSRLRVFPLPRKFYQEHYRLVLSCRSRHDSGRYPEDDRHNTDPAHCMGFWPFIATLLGMELEQEKETVIVLDAIAISRKPINFDAQELECVPSRPRCR